MRPDAVLDRDEILAEPHQPVDSVEHRRLTGEDWTDAAASDLQPEQAEREREGPEHVRRRGYRLAAVRCQ